MKTVKGRLKRVQKYWLTQEKKIKKSQFKQFEFFILGFVLFYLILSGIAYLVPVTIFESSVALPVQSLLSAQGLEVTTSTTVYEELGETVLLFVDGKTLIISWLCSGVLEIIILVSAILASFGIKWKRKFQGIAVGIVAGYFFNLLRVWVTANIVLTQEMEVIEFAHDFLFRAALFLYITGFYVLWFYWAINKSKN